MDRTKGKDDLHGDTKEQSGFAMPRLLRTIIPGAALCLAVTLGAFALGGAETALFGRDWLEALVLAILIGALIRSLWTPPERFTAGIRFTAQYPLELAILLLGATLDTKLVLAAGLLTIVSDDSDATLRGLLAAHDDLHDIEVTAHTMDEAFLALTEQRDPEGAVR